MASLFLTFGIRAPLRGLIKTRSNSLLREKIMSESSFVQPAVPKFDEHYDHWAMLMENFLRSKEYWGVVEN